MDKILLRPAEVADMLGIGRSKTYELIAAGQIPSIRIGTAVRVPLELLQEWVRNRVTGADSAGLPA